MTSDERGLGGGLYPLCADLYPCVRSRTCVCRAVPAACCLPPRCREGQRPGLTHRGSANEQRPPLFSQKRLHLLSIPFLNDAKRKLFSEPAHPRTHVCVS